MTNNLFTQIINLHNQSFSKLSEIPYLELRSLAFFLKAIRLKDKSNQFNHKLSFNNLLDQIPNDVFKGLSNEEITFFISYIEHLSAKNTFFQTCLETKVKQLFDLNLKKIKTSDTLFIMGPGPSINEYTDKQFEHISNYDSYGLSTFILHDFIPTLQQFEVPGVFWNEYIINNLKVRQKDYQNTITIYRKSDNGFTMDFARLPDSILENMFIYFPFDLGTGDMSEYKTLLNMAKEHNIIKPTSNIPFYLSRRSSVIDAINYGVFGGYKNVVLCGIDLNTPCHFFEDNRDYYSKKGLIMPDLFYDKMTLVHETNDKKYGSCKIIDVINEFKGNILDYFGIKMYVGSTKSALFPTYPLYRFS